MNTALVLDIVFAAALLLSVLIGAKRGLFKSLMSLIVIVAALIGASFFANMFTDPVTDIVMPKVEQKVEAWLDIPEMSVGDFLGGMYSSDSDAADRSRTLLEKLNRFGIGGEFLDTVQDTAKETVSGVADAAVDAAAAASRSLVRTIVHAALLLAFYLLLSIVLKLVVRLLDAALDKIPVVNKVNGIGGAAIGLAECALMLFVICYIAPRLGIALFTENVDETYLVSFFTNHSPASLLALLNH